MVPKYWKTQHFCRKKNSVFLESVILGSQVEVLLTALFSIAQLCQLQQTQQPEPWEMTVMPWRSAQNLLSHLPAGGPTVTGLCVHLPVCSMTLGLKVGDTGQEDGLHCRWHLECFTFPPFLCFGSWSPACRYTHTHPTVISLLGGTGRPFPTLACQTGFLRLS